MRKKLSLINGTLGLAIAASLFVACQDFPVDSDKGQQASKTPAAENLQQASLAASPQDSTKDLPAQAVATPPNATIPPAAPVVVTPPEPTTPPAVQPAPPPASTSLTPEQQACLDAYNVMQSGGGDYSQAKDQYVGKGCDQVLGALKPDPRPYTPPTTAELCGMYRKNVVTQPTGDAKYNEYMAQQAIMCADYP